MLGPGSVVGGKYRLQRLVGKGANATVWAASHETLGRQVAVKCVRAEAVTSQETITRFLREARIAASLRHRYIVDIFDFGTTDDGMPFMVMELLKGESLAERLSVGPPTPVKTFLGFVDMALTALATAHRAGIIHRDLKPENIFLDHDSDGATYLKIVDFGISMVHEPFTAIRRIDHLERRVSFENTPVAAGQHIEHLTAEGVVVGTPAYMSPEQVRDVSDLDLRTDLYSMGVILYEALGGRLPHAADNVPDLMVQIATRSVVPLVELRPELGLELSEVVARAMAKQRDDRFADAGEMRRALLAVELGPRSLFTIVVPGSHRRATTDKDMPDVDTGRFEGRAELAAGRGEPDTGDQVKTIPVAAPRRGLLDRRLLLAAIATLLLGAVAGVAAVAWSGAGAATPRAPAAVRGEEPAAAALPPPLADAAPATLAPSGPDADEAGAETPTVEAPATPAPLDSGPATDAADAGPPGEAAPARARPPRRRRQRGDAPPSFRDPGF